MKILFVHQNYPGQFLHLAPAMIKRGHEVMVITDAKNNRKITPPHVRYTFNEQKAEPGVLRLGRNYTAMSDRGVVVARAALTLRDDNGYYPDVIFAHSGWGESLFLKQVWPKAKLIVYAEFYYRGNGIDVGFDLEFSKPSFDQALISQARAAYLTQSIVHADAALSPTRFQADTHPDMLRKHITVIHDGVDTKALAPNRNAKLALPNGQTVTPGDEVLTFVNRNLEPYRGYHIFMRALPEVLRARPNAQVVLVGGDEVSYGAPAPEGKKWKDIFLDEVKDQLDLSRVHFMGKVPYPDFVNLLHVSRAHAYLTYPFVLSWSSIEAMAAGCHIVASNTAPVREAMEHGKTATMVEFFDVPAWSAALIDALANPEKYQPLREAARKHAVTYYDLQSYCLPQMIAFVESFAPGREARLL
jgi:glycosyltransferase involved in cell wall biosynthesis